MASKVESRLKKLSKCDKEELLRTGTGLDDFMDGILH
jgi:predicted GIY-YIG superfamily endonuclease